jgi:uncharacterized protein YhaN
MRFDQLDLIRFGKFTDQSLALPAAAHDFHVIVGPNEAGKSTVRAAVQDLLYGIPSRTPHAFHHAMPELRLGATLSHAGAALALQRVKGLRNTLRNPADAPLPDDALLPFIGSTDKDFFTQMFGLDHERLVAGGSSILSSSNDLGQILFQSAAGIGSLGTLRKALEDEAGKLWTKNKSRERDYYVAAEELDKATAALKAATVRSKDWTEAQALVTTLEAAMAEAKQQHADVRQRRAVLERIHRVALPLQALADAQAALAHMGDVPLLPEGSAKALTEAERTLAVAQAEIDRQAQLLDAAQHALAELTPDATVRERADDITQLNENRLQFRAHEGDIQRRLAEVAAQWGVAAGLARQMGWPAESEDAVRKQLPPPVVRMELARLVQERPALQGRLEAAERAQQTKKDDIAHAQAELKRLTSAAAPVGLQTALARAQQLGNFEALTRDLRQASARRSAAQEAAFAALGTWRQNEAALRAMAPPSLPVIQALLQDQTADDATTKAAQARVRKLQQQIAAEALAISQYRQTHTPVTREDVLAARTARAQTWAHITAEPDGLARLGDAFDAQVQTADQLADRSHDTVQQASELQAKEAQRERFAHELRDAEAEVAALCSAADARAARWAALAEQAGLAGLPLETAEAWLALRQQALTAAEALEEATAQEQNHALACAEATDALAQALQNLGAFNEQATAVTAQPLAVLVRLAQDMVTEMTTQQGQRQTLDKQLSDAQRALEPLAQTVAKAQADMAQWDTRWQAALTAADWATDMPLARIDGVLQAAERIDDALSAMQQIRTERIDTMRADLDGFNNAAQTLMAQVAPDLAGQTADAIATKLVTRLDAANEAHRQATRLQASAHTAAQQLEEAQARKAQAQASLVPLLQRAGATEPAELVEAIEASDLKRSLQARYAQAEQSLQATGDGLPLADLQAEAATMALTAVLEERETLTAEDESLVERMAEVAAKLSSAKTALAAIGGTADAATAEAQRQEAIAKMTDTVERYLKVYTGARLLKWSIERYREVKQGPMLQSASRIFASLTLGSFDKLTVDFDSEPLKLVGRRTDGKSVEVAGMSEGTRDQLYFALRLAALELHLSQAHALPFIADDLFINYDDARSTAGLRALRDLSRSTQVLFLTHHHHLLPAITEVFGADVNVVTL